MPTPIDNLDLNIRAYKRLKEAGVVHLEDLQTWTEERLRAIKGMGHGAISDIERLMNEFNLKLAPSTPGWAPIPYKLSFEQRTEIRRRWAGGESTEVLAAEFSVSTGAIYYTCRGTKRPGQAAEKRRGGRMPDPEKEQRNQEIRRRRQAGERVGELAKAYGFSHTYIHVICKGMHVQREDGRQAAPSLSPEERRHRQIANTIQTQYRTVVAASEYLNLRRDTFHEYLHNGKFPGAFQIGGAGTPWLIPLASLDAYKNRSKRPRPEKK